jgi:hypothetical protein
MERKQAFALVKGEVELAYLISSLKLKLEDSYQMERYLYSYQQYLGTNLGLNFSTVDCRMGKFRLPGCQMEMLQVVWLLNLLDFTKPVLNI